MFAETMFVLGQFYLGQFPLRPSSTWANLFFLMCVRCVRCVCAVFCVRVLCVLCYVCVCCVLCPLPLNPPPPDRPKFRIFSSHAPISRFFSLLGGLLVELWSRIAAVDLDPKRTLWVVHGRDPRPQFHEKTLQEGKKERQYGGRVKKKEAKCWAPHPSGRLPSDPHACGPSFLSAPNLLTPTHWGATFSAFGPPPSGPHPHNTRTQHTHTTHPHNTQQPHTTTTHNNHTQRTHIKKFLFRTWPK